MVVSLSNTSLPPSPHPRAQTFSAVPRSKIHGPGFQIDLKYTIFFWSHAPPSQPRKKNCATIQAQQVCRLIVLEILRGGGGG